MSSVELLTYYGAIGYFGIVARDQATYACKPATCSATQPLDYQCFNGTDVSSIADKLPSGDYVFFSSTKSSDCSGNPTALSATPVNRGCLNANNINVSLLSNGSISATIQSYSSADCASSTLLQRSDTVLPATCYNGTRYYFKKVGATSHANGPALPWTVLAVALSVTLFL